MPNQNPLKLQPHTITHYIYKQMLLNFKIVQKFSAINLFI
jgi:hypothetical protein